jgi:hypothetical protein
MKRISQLKHAGRFQAKHSWRKKSIKEKPQSKTLSQRATPDPVSSSPDRPFRQAISLRTCEAIAVAVGGKSLNTGRLLQSGALAYRYAKNGEVLVLLVTKSVRTNGAFPREMWRRICPYPRPRPKKPMKRQES